MPDPLKTTISATESPALWNVSPYATRWLLFHKFANGMSLDEAPNPRMNWGLKMQPLILAQAAEELRLEVIPNHDVYFRRGLLGATRDATVICPDRGLGALETKCCFDYGVWMRDWDGGKTVPRHHEIQLQTQMFVGNGDGSLAGSFEWGVICAWVGAEQFYFERRPVEELWLKLQSEADKFFASVAAKEEPDPFGAPIEIPWLTALFPTERGTTLDLSQDYEHIKTSDMVAMYAHHKAQESEGKKGSEPIRAQLLALARNYETVLLPQGVKVKIGGNEKSKRLSVYVPDHPSAPPAAPIMETLSAG
jgi:hypothetical protein